MNTVPLFIKNTKKLHYITQDQTKMNCELRSRLKIQMFG